MATTTNAMTTSFGTDFGSMFSTGFGGLNVPSESNSYNYGGMIESGFSATHSFADVFGAYSFGVDNYSASAYNISGYSNPYSAVQTQTYSSVNSSSWYNVGTRNGYIQNFNSGIGANSGVLNFQNSNISSFRRETDFVNFHMADGTSFQAQNSSSSNEAIQYSTDGVNVSYAKLGYSDRDNFFTYDDGVNFYSGGDHTDVLQLTNYQSRNIWLDGSAGVAYNKINNIDASQSSGNNTLAGNSSDNEIIAGSGNDSLWGGAGNSTDVLIGGDSGSDTFFYGKNDGNDTIQNAKQNDVVNLYDVTLADITTASFNGNAISLGFNTGFNLNVNVSSNLSPTFRLADGTNWQYNKSAGNWQSA